MKDIGIVVTDNVDIRYSAVNTGNLSSIVMENKTSIESIIMRNITQFRSDDVEYCENLFAEPKEYAKTIFDAVYKFMIYVRKY